MRGKRILAWICALCVCVLCVCVSLTGCAMGVDLEGMSADELAELEAAATEKLEERRQIDLDAMSDEELEALAALARERLESTLGGMSFDELIALESEVETRLGPVPEVTPSEDVLVLQYRKSGDWKEPYIGGIDIPVGTWYASPLPRGYTHIGCSGSTKGIEQYVLDDRAGGGILSEVELMINEGMEVYVMRDPIVLKRNKNKERTMIFNASSIITKDDLDSMSKGQLETLYYDIHALLYSNALKFVDKKWKSDKAVVVEEGLWHVGTDIPSGEWMIQAENETLDVWVYPDIESCINEMDFVLLLLYGEEPKTISLMANTYIKLYDPAIFLRE